MPDKEPLNSKFITLDEIKEGEGQLSEEEVYNLRQIYPEGMSLWEIIEIVESRISDKLSEATFRRYVKDGTVSGCLQHVGQKGLHRGAQGRYSVASVNQVIEVKEYVSGPTVTNEDLSTSSAYTSKQSLALAEEHFRRALDDLDIRVKDQGSPSGELAMLQDMLKQLLGDGIEIVRYIIQGLDEEFKLSLKK